MIFGRISANRFESKRTGLRVVYIEFDPGSRRQLVCDPGCEATVPAL